MSRKNKLLLNTITSVVLQVVTLVCGFILPRLILEEYGSEVNGLVHSISQFLGVVTLLDMGVGSVVQSSLYKPLAEKDNDMISKIYVSANKFFRSMALILLAYTAVLMIIYPTVLNKNFGILYTMMLIAAMCISNFAQFYFGIVNSLLLNADQKGYIQYVGQIMTLILNTTVCAFLIHAGFSIQLIKLATSLIFLLRPLFMQWYVKMNYTIDRKISYSEEPIKQKWNGMAQHFASFVLDGTDIIVLTFFSTLENVSVYSVYNMVTLGIKNMIVSVANGFRSLTGEMLAKNEEEKLKSAFSNMEWFIHTLTTVIFGSTAVLIVDFVRVYTNGVTDVDYIQPLFAFFLTAANAGHCLRLPYNILILAAGHYKQTQSNYIIAMIINMVFSVATVFLLGLIGVAIGTFAAMTYQTIWMAWYDFKNIINMPMKNFWKHMGIDLLTIVFASFITLRIPMISVSYIFFFVRAFEVFTCWVIISVIINMVFYREQTTAMGKNFF